MLHTHRARLIAHCCGCRSGGRPRPSCQSPSGRCSGPQVFARARMPLQCFTVHPASCILRVARVAHRAAYSAVRGQVHALRYVCTRCFVVLCDRCAALRTTGFSFSKSDLVRDVPYDPELVSLGLLPQAGCACALHTMTTRPPGISLALQGWRSAPAKSTASSQRSTACRSAAQHAATQHSTACECQVDLFLGEEMSLGPPANRRPKLS